MTEPVQISARDLQELRDRYGISLPEAKRNLLRQATLDAIDQAQDLDAIKSILRMIVENWAMKP